jgi:hypothetical protein
VRISALLAIPLLVLALATCDPGDVTPSPSTTATALCPDFVIDRLALVASLGPDYAADAEAYVGRSGLTLAATGALEPVLALGDPTTTNRLVTAVAAAARRAGIDATIPRVGDSPVAVGYGFLAARGLDYVVTLETALHADGAIATCGERPAISGGTGGLQISSIGAVHIVNWLGGRCVAGPILLGREADATAPLIRRDEVGGRSTAEPNRWQPLPESTVTGYDQAALDAVHTRYCSVE